MEKPLFLLPQDITQTLTGSFELENHTHAGTNIAQKPLKT